MAAEVSEILEYIMWLVWTCFSLTPDKLKTPVFLMVIASQDILEDLLLEWSRVCSWFSGCLRVRYSAHYLVVQEATYLHREMLGCLLACS
jgi:hypothetical protein